MVLLVPSDDPSDILKLDYHLSTSAERSESGKAFIDKINAEFKKEFANDFEVKWGRPDVTLTMPLFSLKGSADVHDILKKVSTSLTRHRISCRSCRRIPLQCMMHPFWSGVLRQESSCSKYVLQLIGT